MNRLAQLLATLILIGFNTSVFAHTGHGVHGFGAGLAHPYTGLDHLLAMVAVGLWAAQSHTSRRSILALPATFMLALAGGAALSMSSLTLPALETGIALSVLAFGLLIALAARVPAIVSLLITSVFGLFHGYAHGLEMPAAAAPLMYAAGFLLATASLHLTGVALGLAARRHGALLLRIAGALIAATGASLLVLG